MRPSRTRPENPAGNKGGLEGFQTSVFAQYSYSYSLGTCHGPEQGWGEVKGVHTPCGPGTGQSGDGRGEGPGILFWNMGCTLVTSHEEVWGSPGRAWAGGGRLEARSRS